MLGKPEIRDLELEDIYQHERFTDCLSQIAPCELTKKAMEGLYFDRQHMGMRTLVAVIDDFVVGTATIIIEPKFIHNGARCGHIEDVAVHPDFHGHGIGRQLMQELLEIARKNNCYKLLLNCEDEVVDFYKKFDFYKTPNNMRLDLV
jgi:glucosamine-phosphate N-acetyltransferase